MATLYLDTHAVLWLCEARKDVFGGRALSLIAESDLYISPIVSLELTYLYEVNKVNSKPNRIVKILEDSLGLKVCDKPFYSVIQEAEQMKWTRDPFDRLIVAQASMGKKPLLSKDKGILKHYSKAVW